MIRITNVFKADRRLWLEYCMAALNATFFHSPMWAELFEKQSKYFVTDTRCVEFNDGLRVIIPMVKKTILPGLLNVYLSMPGSTYGGGFHRNLLEVSTFKHLKTTFWSIKILSAGRILLTNLKKYFVEQKVPKI
ncbi:MAG: hypothetical protein GX640_22235 [Fibrobacter sp.]|nr:hypothetical protein [Fibrobacter sp.]